MPHIHEKIDFTVDVFIVHENKVLLRKHDKYNIWLGVGGHIELDEDPVQAAIRECKEEVNLDVEIVPKLDTGHDDAYTELQPPQFMNRHYINEHHEHISLIYFAKAKDVSQLKDMEGREMSKGLHWFTETELDNPFYGVKQSIAHYGKEALKRIR